MDRDLVEEFSQADGVPDLALALALLQPDRIADATLRVIEAAAWGEALSRRDENLLFWGIHVLGAARQERAFRPLMRLLRLSSDRLDELLGDAMTETLPRIVAGAFDGDAQELMAVIADPSLDDSLRWQLFGALAFLTQVDRIDRAKTIRFLCRFDDERLAVEGDVAWEGWAEAIALLGLREMAERLNAALRDGRVTEEISGREWFEEMLRRAEADPEDLTRFGRAARLHRGSAGRARLGAASGRCGRGSRARGRIVGRGRARACDQFSSPRRSQRSVPMRQRQEVQEVLPRRTCGLAGAGFASSLEHAPVNGFAASHP
jgi:uncharacterized protein